MGRDRGRLGGGSIAAYVDGDGDDVQGDEQAPSPWPRYKGVAGFLRKLSDISGFNEFLIEHSELYNGVKGSLLDRSRHWSLADFEFYELGSEPLERSIAGVAEFRDLLQAHDIELRVLILPYEYQLRTRQPEYLEPQRLLSERFRELGITHYDLYEETILHMDQHSLSSQSLFLFSDHAHPSSLGSEFIAKQVVAIVRGNAS